MNKSKLLAVLGIVLIGLSMVACAGPVGPSGPAGPAGPPGAAAMAIPERMPPTIKAVPDMGTPRQRIDYYGANFKPGEELKVALLMSPGPLEFATETIVSSQGIVVGEMAPGGVIIADGVGSFHISRIWLPKEVGIWPVRVYDADGNVIASTLVVVKAAE
ncbi:hypothetical protein ACFLXH_00565 [Chloroflexota bacterium]